MKNDLTFSLAGLRAFAARFLVVAIAAASVCLVSACKENKTTDEGKHFVEGVVIPDDNTEECTMSEARITVTFETEGAYTLESSDTEMLAIEAGYESGSEAGRHTAKVKVARNDTGEDRKATLYITVEGYNRTALYEFEQSGGAADPVITWMDQRLQKEYYWLDEYNGKRSDFDFSLAYDKFLNASLLSLTTNEMDGGRYDDGTRYIYSYITRLSALPAAASTRAPLKVSGLGISVSSYMWTMNAAGTLYGFAVEHVYDGSPAAAAGMHRGDIIIQVNGADITRSNYEDLWYGLVNNQYSSVTLRKMDYSTGDEADVNLSQGSYNENPVAYSGIIPMPEGLEGYPNKIGYLVYLSFDADYDDALADAVADLKAEGVTDLILDLRSNGGGSVNSSIKLASMILDASYAGKTYATLKRNPANEYGDTHCPIDANVATHLGLTKLWVIASNNTASASEMVIKGLEGLDVPVEIVGAKTEGKNCGMDVMEMVFDRYTYEFAPITFLNYNAKGDNDYADGIEADVDLATYFADADETQKQNAEMFPIPLGPWGVYGYDIALYETMMRILGKTLKGGAATPEESLAAPRPVTRGGVAPAVSELRVKDVRRSGMTLTEEERRNIEGTER